MRFFTYKAKVNMRKIKTKPAEPEIIIRRDMSRLIGHEFRKYNPKPRAIKGVIEKINAKLKVRAKVETKIVQI